MGLAWSVWTASTVNMAFAGWTSGTGPLLLWLHDELALGPDPTAESLAHQFTVTIPTHPGFGDAPRPAWVESTRDLTDLYVDLLESVGGPVVVGGASFGGWLAAELATARPDLVSFVLLAGPAGLWSADHPAADHWFTTDDERQVMLFADPAAEPTVGLDERLANDEALARYAWSPRLADRGLAHRLHRARMPVALVWGTEDLLLPPAQAALWAARLPDVRVSTVAGAGHFVHRERPDAVTAALRVATRT